MDTTCLKATVRYQGTRFCGWQRQDNGRTVQGEIETALSRIADRPIAVQGAGRTDAGVHALGQVFSCLWQGSPPQRLAHGLCKMLAPEIRIESLEPVRDDFNARFDAKGKRYVYSFSLNRHADPLQSLFVWHVPYPVDLDLVRQGLSIITGRHDFAGFQSQGSQSRTTVRTLVSARLYPGAWCGPADAKYTWTLEFIGDGFLYKMVRNLCGTLIGVGRGRFPLSFIEDSLSRGAPFLGHCAPPHGLALAEVYYEDLPGNTH